MKLPLEAKALPPGSGRGNLSSRLVIGAIAAVAIGLAAYFVYLPRRGSVEYHKREFLKFSELTSSPLWVDRNGVPDSVRTLYRRRLTHRVHFHLQALIEAGYLKKGVFIVSNAPPLKVLQATGIEFRQPNSNFTIISWSLSRISVNAPGELMEEIGEAIRKADVPEKEE
jgi:hypothetical protein